MKKILAINPGSTSTKIALFHDDQPVMKHTIKHTPEELHRFTDVFDQEDWRRDLILGHLREQGIPLDFDAVMARGGLAQVVEGGTYVVDDYMRQIMRQASHRHACDLGCLLAYDIAALCDAPAYIADPGVTDERCPEARINGSAQLTDIPIWHALNQKAIGRRHAAKTGTRYEDLRLIIVHLGGGISVGAHLYGRTVDVPNALDGSGPFSPERAGTLPAGALVHLCFSGRHTEAEIMKMIAGKGGLVSHLGTSDAIEVERRIDQGDEKARLVYDAMVYQVAKAVGGAATVLEGKVDAILVTGGIAYSDYVIERLRQRVEWIAPLIVYPGEDELLALAQNGLAVLEGRMQPKHYPQLAREEQHVR